jgi:hypothetical protein
VPPYRPPSLMIRARFASVILWQIHSMPPAAPSTLSHANRRLALSNGMLAAKRLNVRNG